MEAVRKDFEKLLREETTGMWFHTLHKANRGTLNGLLAKFRKALSSLSGPLATSRHRYLVAFFTLDNGVLNWQWLELWGDPADNTAAVDAMFGNGIQNACWARADFDLRPDAPSKGSRNSVKGKGQREAFLVFIPVTEWIPATAEDMRHNVDTDPQYWCKRLRGINRARASSGR